MRHQEWLGAAALAFALAGPAWAQSIDTILVEPPYPTTRDRIQITFLGTEAPTCPLVWKGPELIPELQWIELKVTFSTCGTSSPQDFRRTFTLDPLPAGTYWIVLNPTFPVFNHREIPFPIAPSEILEIREPNPLLELGQDGQFGVRVEWSNPHDGSHGAGDARRYAEDSGAFSFFSSSNLEVTVKILDGRPINGHWWVFIANMTDLEVKVTVEKGGAICEIGAGPLPCPTKTYTQTAGSTRNFVDVNAFAGFLPAAQTAHAADPEPDFSIRITPERPTTAVNVHLKVTILTYRAFGKEPPDLIFGGLQGNRFIFDYSDSAETAVDRVPRTVETDAGPLKAGIYTVEVRGFTQILDTTFSGIFFTKTFEVTEASDELTLLPAPDGTLFSVSIEFEYPSGSGLHKTAHGVPLTRESGYFWLFEKDNAEVTVKILDGRPVNGRYWVFLSSMTDLKFTATVTQCPNLQDHTLCFSKTYQSTQGVNQNIIDTSSWGPEGDGI